MAYVESELVMSMKNSSCSAHGSFILGRYTCKNVKGGEHLLMISFIEVFILAGIFGVLYMIRQVANR